MIEAFIEHIKNKSLLDSNEKYLLACSGGLDSVCLGTLLYFSKINFEVAHVNFQLREKESDDDEKFVRLLAESWRSEFHVLHAETSRVRQEKNLSTQMAAREIRYDWFEKIRKTRNLQGIIIAHHQDDQLETIFLNLLRGTGIEGLYGMADRRGFLIRPLLPFSRKNILDYAKEKSLKWREDSSNTKTDYKRNKLRLDVLPIIYNTSEDSRANLITSFNRLKDTGRAFSGLFELWKSKSILDQDGFQSVKFEDFMHLDGTASILYFWLRSYGFNSDQVQEIYQSCLAGEAGKFFQSPDHILNIDRNQLILAPKAKHFDAIEISENDLGFILPEGKYEILKLKGEVDLDKSSMNAMLDLDQLNFPLTIRTWKEGDRFIPLGMKNSKKISDFLIDLKIPLIKKQEIRILESGEKIAWIIGYRIADWAKHTAATRKTLYLKKR
ncbi:tRNA lysidine(34) synthetase TilS [Algoriphagus sp.]|uniref:tRNA lysidine(34) synthetase TilS n=1 Tax=Algoriphagus sp. TaxID=1872435 RepID=UPI0025EADEC7|nr:tRNA lysidine(34) synthetase TilS [Algoriphagus sp.]